MSFDSIRDLNANGTLISVSTSMIGVTLEIKRDALTDEARRAGAKARKNIIGSQFIKPVQSAANTTRNEIRRLCVPFGMNGIWWTNNGLIERIEQKWEERREPFEIAVRQFIERWSEILDEAERRLGSFFNPSDYPNEQQLPNMFKMRIRRFNIIGSSASGSENEVTQMLEEFKQDASLLLREQFLELLDHMVDRLTPEMDENGNEQRKIFRDSLVTNMTDFLDTFRHLNVADDEALNEQVVRVRALLAARGIEGGQGADLLRNNDTIRNHVRERFGEIRGIVNEAITQMPTRRMRRS